MFDKDTLEFLQSLLVEEMDKRLEKLKGKYKDNPEDAGLSYEQGMIHGIDVSVQKIYSMLEG